MATGKQTSLPHGRSENGLRILILEDVPSDAALMERELQKSGMKFSAARVDGRDPFLAALKTLPPDIILSDYSLPGFDGVSALSLAQENTPDVPFIFVTGPWGKTGPRSS